MKWLKNWFNFSQPDTATPEEWDTYEEKFRNHAPVRYRIYQLKRTIKNKVYFIRRKFSDWIYFKACPPHIIITKLEPNKQSSRQELAINALFRILEDYVEIDLFCESAVFTEERRKWKGILFSLNFSSKYAERRPDKGLSYLQENNIYSALNPETSNTIQELYLWWKIVRPLRKLPEYPLKTTFLVNRKSSDYLVIKDHYDLCRQIEKKWEEEDNKKMMLLVSIIPDLL